MERRLGGALKKLEFVTVKYVIFSGKRLLSCDVLAVILTCDILIQTEGFKWYSFDCFTKRRYAMGDKGGNKDKDKAQKQKIKKNEQKAKKKLEKQQKKH
jgi:hypothetical protein